jgi:hypothetical protein
LGDLITAQSLFTRSGKDAKYVVLWLRNAEGMEQSINLMGQLAYGTPESKIGFLGNAPKFHMRLVGGGASLRRLMALTIAAAGQDRKSPSGCCLLALEPAADAMNLRVKFDI